MNYSPSPKGFPLQLKSYISPQSRAKASDAIKEVFHRCPNCSRYSLKPNYNMILLKSVNDLPDIIKKYGRKCICGYQNKPEIQSTL